MISYDGAAFAFDCFGRNECSGESAGSLALDAALFGLERGAGLILKSPYLALSDNMVNDLKTLHSAIDAQIGVGIALSSELHSVENSGALLQVVSSISGVINLG